MSYTLVFDQSKSSSNDFTEDVEIELDLVKRSELDLKRGWTEFTTSNPEDNLQTSIGKRKKGRVSIEGVLYNNGVDKSNGTLQKAINNGDLSTVDVTQDDRLEFTNIDSVSTSNDEVTVKGDISGRVDTSSSIVVFASTGNDDTYDVDSVSYDSTSDETTISVAGDIGNSTADGSVQTGVVSLDEQSAWLEDYVFSNAGAPYHVIQASRFNDDGSEDGKRVVIENAITDRVAGRLKSNFTVNMRLGRPI